VIDFSYKVKGQWSVLDKELVMPLVQIGRWWATQVRNRISSTGQGARGAFSPYASSGDARHWVRPGLPQPRSSQYKILEGPFIGWSVYPSYDEYLRLLGRRGRPKTFRQSGRRWARLRVTAVSPAHVQIRFMGSVDGMRVERLMRQLLGPERQGLLTPTSEEWAHMQRMLRESIRAQIFEAAEVAADAFSVRRSAALAQGRAAKVVRRMTAL